jgi:hypothetical protein
MFGMRIAGLLAASLFLPLAAHAQFGGEGKPANETSTIHYVCTPEGAQTVHDDYSGSTYVDKSATRKYMLPIDGARARGEWNEVNRLADMSIKNAPSCYYAEFSKAQAQLYFCKLPEAKATLETFLAHAEKDKAYATYVTFGKNMLDSINSGDAAAKCQ